ncbi:hypothetical protein ACUN0C_14640 [Faunimonas sp. B44]|uniref:hypothetical protein n=1 Tax=Faunimonas sp. B44 TaxID=3461493 RepID=UPI004044EB45
MDFIEIELRAGQVKNGSQLGTDLMASRSRTKLCGLVPGACVQFCRNAFGHSCELKKAVTGSKVAAAFQLRTQQGPQRFLPMEEHLQKRGEQQCRSKAHREASHPLGKRPI